MDRSIIVSVEDLSTNMFCVNTVMKRASEGEAMAPGPTPTLLLFPLPPAYRERGFILDWGPILRITENTNSFATGRDFSGTSLFY